MKEYKFLSLKGMNVVAAQVSDHHPVIYGKFLFWNVMMQGAKRNNGGGYNNGFKITENDNQYLSRLVNIAHVIAEIVYRHPKIEVIGLCEGPINPMHLKKLFSNLKIFPWMKRLMGDGDFHKPNFSSGNVWGLLMLADKRYQLSKICGEQMLQSMNIFEKLANRFQVWEMADKNTKQYFALAHLPFSGDELKKSPVELSEYGKKYCYLVSTVLQSYATKSMVFCADFNINPLIIKPNVHFDRIPLGNSILSLEKSLEKIPVTVDGILLSNHLKQCEYGKMKLRLFEQLSQEHGLINSFQYQPVRSKL